MELRFQCSGVNGRSLIPKPPLLPVRPEAWRLRALRPLSMCQAPSHVPDSHLLALSILVLPPPSRPALYPPAGRPPLYLPLIWHTHTLVTALFQLNTQR